MILAALLLAQAAATPAAVPVCPATPAALPADLAGWTASATDLATMKAVTVQAMGPDTVRPADVPPSTRRGFSALSTFGVRAAGTYGIALGSKGWIDVYRVGARTPVTSIGHGHGPDCSGIAKIVRFSLTPGTYRVVVDGLEERSVKLMLVRG